MNDRPLDGEVRLVSPERRWRCWIALALAAVWVPVAAVLTIATGGAVAEIAVSVLVLVLLLVLAWRISTTYVTVDEHGLADHRVLRTVRVGWDAVSGFEVGRPAGIWDGYCVQAVTPSGERRDLLATRAYSLVPDSHHYDEIHRMAWTLEVLRPQPDAA